MVCDLIGSYIFSVALLFYQSGGHALLFDNSSHIVEIEAFGCDADVTQPLN